MPGPLTYAAVTLLARDRIGQIRRALSAKNDAGMAKELDLHVLYLATEAENAMNAAQPVIEAPVRLYGPPLTDHVSRFVLLGAIGPDLPRYAAYFTPGQRWLFDTLHKGSPDENRELVLAKSTDLVFDFWQRVVPFINTEFSDQTKQKEARDKMRAYVLGHVCHIATDVLSHPYFEAIEARLATQPPNPIRFMGRDDVAGAFDVAIATRFFGRTTDTHNKKWADWFPTPSEVPDSFAKAMVASIQSLYGARAVGLPAFEEAFAKNDPLPPELSEDLINESIDYFRTIIEIQRVWTLPDWLGATAAMFLPIAFAPFGALALPMGKNLSRPLTAADGADAEDRRTYESLVYPVAVSALGPLVTMIIVSASGRGLRAEGITGWVQAGVSLVASVGFFATLGGAGAARWTLWFALPLALAVVQIIFVLARGARENSRKLLWLGPLVQVLLAMLFLLLYRGWLHEPVEELQKDPSERDLPKALAELLGWVAIVAVLWIVNALLWRYVFSSSVPDDKQDFVTGEPRQFLRLYDDIALIHDANKPLDSEHLADLAYPPARRELLKLWWQAGTAPAVQVRIDHDRLVFDWPAPAGTAKQSVFSPIASMTVDRFGQLLAASVTGDATKGTLHVKAARDDEKGLELAAGAVFSDNGDDKTTLVDHDAAAAAFQNVGTTEAAAFTLFHAPRPRLAERVGRNAVAPDSKRGDLPSKVGSLLQLVPGSPRLLRATNATDGTPPFIRKMFCPGDILEIASGGAVGEQRIVEQVLNNDTDLIVSSAFTFVIPPAGIGYKRALNDRSLRLRGASTVTTPPITPGIGPNDVQVDNATVFLGSQFVVGDIVEIGVGTLQQRRVVTVKDAAPVPSAPGGVANLLELDAPLSPVAGGASALGSLLQLVGGAGSRQYHATNGVGGRPPRLLSLFRAGDAIEIASAAPVGEQQIVAQVLNDTDLIVVAAFVAPIPAAGLGYKRISYINRLSDAETDGFPYVADASDVFGDGESAMNDAADLAALLCLGAASRLTENDTLVKPKNASITPHRVYQVFRNWNLDRRRLNEWRTMVSGGAESERRGDFRASEEAAPVARVDATETFSDAFVAQREAADTIVREHGWLGVFRSWVDMASRARTDTTSTEVFRPGAASNRDLSRAMAYLIDASEGVAP